MNIVEPRVTRLPEATAKDVVQAILDTGIVGVALLRGPKHVHVMANAKYSTLVGARASVIDRSLRDVVPNVPEVVLKGVLEGAGSASVREVVAPGVGAQQPRIATFTFHAIPAESQAVLVIAEDVTDFVRERDTAHLFTTLVGELLPSTSPREAVRSVVEQTSRALAAKSSSLFLLAEDGKTLRGTPGAWDWTRTSFEVPLVEWPTIAQSLATGRGRYLTSVEARGAEVGWFEAHGTVGALCVPLRSNDRAIGVLFFDFETVRPPPIASVDFAEQVAAHCAAVLERALTSPT